MRPLAPRPPASRPTTGTSVANGVPIVDGFRRYIRRPYSITRWNFAEYRIELFTPHYIHNKRRPTWSRTPTVVVYGEEFSVTLAQNTSASSIKAVVLMDGGEWLMGGWYRPPPP
jgi:hypothetical protein